MRLPRTSLLPLALAGALCAQESPKSLRAVRTSEAIRMDGRLSEAAWNRAPAASGFTVQWPEFGKQAALRTEVKVLYDDRYLYVGARMHNPGGPKAIVRRLHRRDQESSSDWFTVYVDSLRDRRSAAVFAVNAAGVQRDALISSDSTSYDSSWDAVWESSVSVDAGGWTAKLKIPLSALRVRPGSGPQSWGINFGRSDQGPVRENAYWDLPPRGVNAFVSRFPELQGIEGIQPQLRREWIPYLSTQRKFGTSMPYDDREWTHRAGLDAHLGLSTDSQLDLAVRPDFGQVEVDQAVLNLGTYETYFPEKRPFFLEGMEIFQVAGPTLFYSRRIGQGLPDPDLDPGEKLEGRPQAAEIAAAAKYTAKLDSGLNLGVLGAGVENARADLRDESGRPFQREIYPYTSFGVFRIQQRFGLSGSYVGAFASGMRQAGPAGRAAEVQALDSILKSSDRSSTGEFTLARSRTGTPGEMEDGLMGRLRYNRQWSSGWTVEAQALNVSRSFNPNDAGYLDRPDQQFAYVGASRKWDRSFGPIRNLKLAAEGSVARDQAGVVYQRSFDVSANAETTNFLALWCYAGINLPAHDDRELRTFLDPDKKYLRTERVPWTELGFDTAGNKPWYVRFDLTRAWHEGGPSTDADLYQSIKLNSVVEVQLETILTRDSGERKYLETQGATPITGLRRLGQLNQVLRVSYAFSPALSVQCFAQWMDANWAFRDLKSYQDDDTQSPGAVAQYGTAFSDRLWNLNLITRWEFRPGSALFVVYTHGVSTDALVNSRASISPWPDLAALRHLPSDDVLQVKLSWMFR